MPHKSKIFKLACHMKQYEDAASVILPIGMPIILRLEGKSFRNDTEFDPASRDEAMSDLMIESIEETLSHIHNAWFAYTFEDEVSFLIYNCKNPEPQVWFSNKLQSIVSYGASMMSGRWTEKTERILLTRRKGGFTGNAFVIPEHDVVNYFIWRQMECERNSILNFAKPHFDKCDVGCHNNDYLIKKCQDKGHNWHNLENRWRRGVGVYKMRYGNSDDGGVCMNGDLYTPDFSVDGKYVQEFLKKPKQ